MSKTRLMIMMIMAISWALMFTGCPNESEPELERYTVTFNANGGTGTAPTAQTENAGSFITLPGAENLNRSGYTFGGWNTNSSGTGTNYNAGSYYMVTENITLYAKWNAVLVVYNVTFDINGATSGTAPTTQTANAGSYIMLPIGSGLTRTSYIFGGWNTNSSGTGTNYNAGSYYTVTENITLYAKWNLDTSRPWIGATVTSLAEEAVWYDGNVDVGKEQWFKFTATTTGNQSIHIRFGNLTDLYIQVYSSTGATVGNRTNLYSSTTYISRDVTSGQEYYVKIQPSGSRNGSFKIAFNKQNQPPLYIVGTPITLTQEAVWYDGNVGVNEEQWFKFTATTTGNQSIHIRFGTLTDLYIQVYSSTGVTVGNRTNLYSSTTYISRDVTSGQEYYVKIQPSGSRNGSFKITFNKQNQPPLYIVGTPTTLTTTFWSDGIVGVNEEQWFKFTAATTTGIQYIHIQFGTLTDLYIQVYSSTGATVGNRTNLYSSTRYISRDVTSGQEYYVKIQPSGSRNGSFKIAFNTNATAPN